ISGTVTSNIGTTNGLALDATLTGGSLKAQGNVASAATDSGNPLKIGGVFNTTQPTVTTGQRVDAQMTARGAQVVATGVDTFHTTVDNASLPIQQLGNNTVLSGQQAVTATAAALASNTAKNICVKALIANSINVYVGPAGITTGTGLELAPGDVACMPVANTNLVNVIAST